MNGRTINGWVERLSNARWMAWSKGKNERSNEVKEKEKKTSGKEKEIESGFAESFRAYPWDRKERKDKIGPKLYVDQKYFFTFYCTQTDDDEGCCRGKRTLVVSLSLSLSLSLFLSVSVSVSVFLFASRLLRNERRTWNEASANLLGY